MNEGLSNEEILVKFKDEFECDGLFKYYRNLIQVNKFGYGEDEFCVLWEKIVSSIGREFSFLEIGVFKAQILCLISLIAKRKCLKHSIYGVSSLQSTSDSTTVYESCNYAACIKTLHQHFDIDFDIENQIIKGLSTDEVVKEKLRSMPKFDIVYIDGGHDFETVVSDIKLADEICKKGGYVVTDDSSCSKDFGKFKYIFHGHKEVSIAVDNFLEKNPRYTEKYCVGHLRAFQKNEN